MAQRSRTTSLPGGVSRRRGRRRPPDGPHLPGARRPRDRPPEAEPGLLPDLRRRPRGAAARARPVAAARLRLVLPLLPRPGARPRPRGHARRDPPPGGRLGRATRPRRAGRCRATGAMPPPTSSASRRPPVSQCLPAVGCAEATPLHPGPVAARMPRLRRRDHLRLPRRGGDQRGRVLGEPQHRLPAPPARPVRGGGQRLRHLRAGPRTRRRRPSPRWSGASAVSAHHQDRRARLLRGPPARRPRPWPGCGPAKGRA